MLEPGILVDAATLPLDHTRLPDTQVVAGDPTTGTAVLFEDAEREVGVWEMTPGTATDVEVDEVFVVLFGRAAVYFDGDGFEGHDPIDLYPGAVVRLTDGMETTWVVTETLRKVYMV
jgi:uncharacterized cupin superfamily protein